MAKDFSAFLGPKKKKNLNLTGPNSQSKAKKNLVQTENREVTTVSQPSPNRELTVSQPSPNRELTVSQPLATALVEGSSSSSYFNNNSTTTSDELWKTLDLSSVENFGINQSAIFEARQKFGPFSFVDFEKFLERFGKFMSDNKKSKGIGNARGFFFSLCKQIREGIEPLSEIKTDSDEALALLLKLKKEEKRKREEVERELIAFEFDEWFSDLSDKEKDVISPPTELLKKDSGPYKAVFRNHFEENLWPQIKSKMVQGEL